MSHDLTPAEMGLLRTQTKLLIQDVGDYRACEANCRVSSSTLERYCSPDYVHMIPVDVALALERLAGRRRLTQAMAQLHNHTLVPLSVDHRQPELLKHMGDLMLRCGEAFTGSSEALADGILTAAECAHLARLLHDVIHSASGTMVMLSRHASENSRVEQD